MYLGNNCDQTIPAFIIISLELSFFLKCMHTFFFVPPFPHTSSQCIAVRCRTGQHRSHIFAPKQEEAQVFSCSEHPQCCLKSSATYSFCRKDSISVSPGGWDSLALSNHGGLIVPFSANTYAEGKDVLSNWLLQGSIHWLQQHTWCMGFKHQQYCGREKTQSQRIIKNS